MALRWRFGHPPSLGLCGVLVPLDSGRVTITLWPGLAAWPGSGPEYELIGVGIVLQPNTAAVLAETCQEGEGRQTTGENCL